MNTSHNPCQFRSTDHWAVDTTEDLSSTSRGINPMTNKNVDNKPYQCQSTDYWADDTIEDI
jgi:hypothetical protein